MASVRIHSQSQKPVHSQRIQWIVLLPFIAMLLLYVGVEKGIGGWLFTQLTKVAHSSEGIATLALSIFWGGLTVARALAAFALRRMSDMQLLILATILIFVGAMLIVALPTVEFAGILSAFIMGLGCGPIFPTVLAISARAHPEARGTATGIIMSLGTVGAAAIPWFQGKVGAGVNGGMIVIVVLSFVMIGIAITIKRVTPESAVYPA